MKNFRLAIINTGAANIHSVAKAVRVVGGEPVVTTDSKTIASSHAAILPGVGANDAVMKQLNDLKLPTTIREFATSGKPLLCVCLGMQILFEKSEEGELPGLNVLQGEVVRLPEAIAESTGRPLKIPHMGWNTVRFRDEAVPRHPIFTGIPQKRLFLFRALIPLQRRRPIRRRRCFAARDRSVRGGSQRQRCWNAVPPREKWQNWIVYL